MSAAVVRVAETSLDGEGASESLCNGECACAGDARRNDKDGAGDVGRDVSDADEFRRDSRPNSDLRRV